MKLYTSKTQIKRSTQKIQSFINKCLEKNRTNWLNGIFNIELWHTTEQEGIGPIAKKQKKYMKSFIAQATTERELYSQGRGGELTNPQELRKGKKPWNENKIH